MSDFCTSEERNMFKDTLYIYIYIYSAKNFHFLRRREQSNPTKTCINQLKILDTVLYCEKDFSLSWFSYENSLSFCKCCCMAAMEHVFDILHLLPAFLSWWETGKFCAVIARLLTVTLVSHTQKQCLGIIRNNFPLQLLSC